VRPLHRGRQGGRRILPDAGTNVLAGLPKRLHGDAKTALAEIYTADTRAAAVDAAAEFATKFAANPKATAKITGDLDVLLTFYDYAVEHHKHLRTTKVTESTFATVRLRPRTMKGPGCREAGVAMAYKLLDAAQARWRRVNGPELVALVRAGATFIDGKLQERSDTTTEPAPEECAA
jgi:transposase-like protein